MQRTPLRLSVDQANTEYQAQLPRGVVRLQVVVHTEAEIRFSLTIGEVAADPPGGRLVSRQVPYDDRTLDSVSGTFYYASSVQGALFTVIAWHTSDQDIGAFSDGFAEGFV